MELNKEDIMENTIKNNMEKSNFEFLKLKDEFSIPELESMLDIKANTIKKYSVRYKDFLSSKATYNQKDIQTLMLIQSMTLKGLKDIEIEVKIFEYHQLMKKTMNGTRKTSIKFLKNIPKSSGLIKLK